MHYSLIEGLPQVGFDVVLLVSLLVGLISWAIRQEAGGKRSAEKIDDLQKELAAEKAANAQAIKDLRAEYSKKFESMEKKHSDLDDKVMDKLSSIEKIVFNIQGQLASK